MKLSVIVPARNEEETIGDIFESISKTLQGSSAVEDYEVIVIDDGSNDSTWKRLQQKKNSKLKLVHFEKPLGKTRAIQAGFEKTVFDFVATCDADLQNDPADLLCMEQKLREGWDYVIGWRKVRRDSIVPRLSSKIANAVRRAVLKDSFRDIASGLQLFKKDCLNGVIFFEGMHRFLPYIALKRGFRVTECEVHHRPRRAGRSKYGVFNRALKSTMDLVRVKFQWG